MCKLDTRFKCFRTSVVISIRLYPSGHQSPIHIGTLFRHFYSSFSDSFSVVID